MIKGRKVFGVSRGFLLLRGITAPLARKASLSLVSSSFLGASCACDLWGMGDNELEELAWQPCYRVGVG